MAEAEYSELHDLACKYRAAQTLADSMAAFLAIEAHVQALVLAERERCAALVETTPAEAFCTVMHQAQLQRARDTFASAIREG